MKYDFELDMDSDNSLSMIIKRIKKNATVLEFGPAMGRMTRYLKEELSCRVVIVECDEEGYRSAIRYGENGFCGDAETLAWRECFRSYQFDYIIFADVLEHLRDPQKVVKTAAELLAEGGQVLLSVPNIGHNSILVDLYHGKFQYRDVGLLDRTHIHFFTYASLKEMIEDCGLEVVLEDATQSECEHTEFGNSLAQLPAEIRYAVSRREYAYVYQFIFFCRKKAEQANGADGSDIVRRIAKNHKESFMVFIDCGEGYHEENKISKAVQEGENKYCIMISHPETVQNLRIDFAEFPCRVRLISLKVDGCEVDRKALKTNSAWCSDQEYEFYTIDPQMEFQVHDFSGEIQVDFYLEALTLDVLNRLAVEKSQKMAAERERHRLQVKQKMEQMGVSHAREIQALHEQYQAQIQVIYHSTSWKLTVPFRMFAESVKKIGRILMPRKVRKGLYIILHEGFSAFFDRFSAYRNRKRTEKIFFRRLLTLSETERKEQRDKKFDRDILFSIIVPLYNTPMDYLVEMIESCQNQTYGNWELCLADGSDRMHSYVGEAVREMALSDSRIKYQILESNGGISENTNAALEMASGEYIALLDHDDLLHPAALYEYMKVICEKKADFIYCDEMTFEGKLSHIITMHFKPDFSVDNLRANNYICHFSVFSRQLLEKAGMFRKEFDGSQDHDMVLRLTEKAQNIVHIPQILYFWRSHPDSVASDINSKTYAIDAGRRAVLSHLERCGLKGTVESSWAFPTIFNVKYELNSYPKITVIIPNKDQVPMLSRCIDSIWEKSTYGNYEILVVENNSTEQETFRYYERLEAEGRATVLYYEEEGFNYARINNFAAGQADGEYLLFLNNDIEIITPDWMQEMLMFAQRSDVGAVGAKLYYPDDTIQHAGVVIGMGTDRCAGSVHHRFARNDVGYIGRLCYAQQYSAVTAACLLLSGEIFRSVGGFDERFAVAYNDVDLCLAVREAGYHNIWTPCAEAYHYESVSRGYDETPQNQERFQREVKLFQEKWKAQIEEGDPFYNRNLTLDLPDFSLRREI